MTVSARIQSEPIEVDAECAAFRAAHPDAGAFVTFIGQVRASGGVEALLLEHFPAVAEREIARAAEGAAGRLGVLGLIVVHRVGEMAPEAAIVLVSAAAEHRRSAFEAADFMMDYLKSQAPLWKCERTADGRRWIEPTDEDRRDLERWRA
jgi:molybdopterin synthase catalytic subunit